MTSEPTAPVIGQGREGCSSQGRPDDQCGAPKSAAPEGWPTVFGFMLARWRGPMSLSQAAAKIGCAKPHLWELEKGRTDNPSIKLLRAIGEAYGVGLMEVAYYAAGLGESPDAQRSLADAREHSSPRQVASEKSRETK